MEIGIQPATTVSNALLEKGDIVLVSSLAHYSLCLAIESVGAIWKEVPLNEDNRDIPRSDEGV